MKSVYRFVLMSLTVGFVGCTPYYYLPTKQNTMVFEKKGDIVLSGNIGLFHRQTGLELGYALTDNIGVYSSFNKFDISYYGKQHPFLKDFIWDNELIFFKRHNSGLYTGINLGLGLGKFNVGNPYFNLYLYRQFLQPTLGITVFNHLQFGLSTRIVRLNFNATSATRGLSEYDQKMFDQYFNFKDITTNDFLLIEPAFTMAFKIECFRLQFQYAGITNSNYRSYFINENISTSLSINLNKLFLYKKSKTKPFSNAF